jgi:Fe-S oxidoreductase
MPKIIEMRRYLVMVESRFPKEVTTVFKNFEVNSNPWGMGLTTRGDWCKELGVKSLAEDPDVEWLYYVGCAGSFDERSKRVATAFVRLLQRAGVKFGILGQEEGCCGDSARRSGNEYLFQAMAQQNIEVFNTYQVRRIVTACPHGYNTIKHEYPQLGGNYEVMHHTEFIAQLLADGRLSLPRGGAELSVVYHDSCYLGRYNDLYATPRDLLSKVPGVVLKEMERNRHRAFCCGAGGARMWMEEHLGKRINEMRTEQALEMQPSVICTACPFCMTMLEDGIKAKEMEMPVPVLDIAEILERVMPGREEK